MIFGVQYYRPPFPENRYWEEDFARIKDSGFDTIQFWVHWGWVEPEPGHFVFDDYDNLMALAQANGLRVVLSLCAELQPYWIHRAVPGSQMVDHMGRKVVSSNRGEAHQGMTPGGCTDNPGVLDLMRRFLQTVAARYCDHPSLIGWDCWNELRWCIQADGLVCYCEHTVLAFRQWLEAKYGSLEGLNAAWKRRYGCWEDVEPGRLPGRPYTEIMEFEAFQQWKLAEHLKFRVKSIRLADRKHVISAHEGGPPSLYGWGSMGSYGNGGHMLHALHSGSFFDMAECVDVFGTSHYPGFQTASLAEFGAGVELTRSANGGGAFWISELQGYCEDAALLSTWYWSCLARGAKAVIAWSWRGEVFGRESGSFGILGRNDSTAERLAVFQGVGDVIRQYGPLLDAYLPDRPEVALFHDANAYNLEWAATGDTAETVYSLKGWSKALERAHIPYSFVDSNHPAGLEGIRLLIMPQPCVVPAAAADRVLQFVHEGGTLLLEGGTDAFTELGFYRYAGEERPFASALGIDYAPEIPISQYSPFYQLPEPGAVQPENEIREEILLEFSAKKYTVYAEGLIHPLIEREGDEILARDSNGNILAVMKHIGKGAVLAAGGFLGKGYHRANHCGLERLLSALAEEAGVCSTISVRGGEVYWRTGLAGRRRLLFLVNAGSEANVSVEIDKRLWAFGPTEDLTGSAEYTVSDCGDCWRLELCIGRGGASLFALG
jgi:beta-galactosidase